MKILSALCIALLFSCSSSKKNTSTNVSTRNEIQQTNEIKNLQQTGVDFFAQGNQPSNWTLTINYDDTLRFAADDGLTLKFAYNQLKKDINNERKYYTLALKSGNVQIEILEKICTVSTIREVFKKEVSVSFNSVKYTGCGKFLADNKLQGKWLLEKIGLTPIVVSEYNKVPEMNIEVIAGTISGNDGCNNITGKIEVLGKRIQFYQLEGTKMACYKKSIDKIIAGQVNGQLVSYYFKEGKLYLYLPDDSLLIFKKT